MLDEGLTVGLGTDVSGGYSPSILEVARQACLVSRLLGYSTEFQQMTGNSTSTGHERLSVEESLYLATRGGAAVVDMADDIGGFDKGMIWDAQLIELGAVKNNTISPLDVAHVDGLAGRSLAESGPVGNVGLFGNETWQALLPGAVLKVQMKRVADLCQKPQESISERRCSDGHGRIQQHRWRSAWKSRRCVPFSLCGCSVAHSLQLPGAPQ